MQLGHGELPAEVASRILSMELLVHAWDFARATGQEEPRADALAAYVLGLARDGLIQPALRDGDNFADEVAVGVRPTRWTQLVAYTGRVP